MDVGGEKTCYTSRNSLSQRCLGRDPRRCGRDYHTCDENAAVNAGDDCVAAAASSVADLERLEEIAVLIEERDKRFLRRTAI